MTNKTIQITQDKSLVRIAFNRPNVLNALSETMISEVTTIFQSINQDKSVRVIILEGLGKAFSAGADLSYMKNTGELNIEQNEQSGKNLQLMYQAIEDCSKPVIAKVHGYAIGGGFGFLTLADISIAETNTKFSLSEVKLGINPAVIGPFCVKKIGLSHFKSLGITGELIDTERALRIGLIHEVASAETIEDVVIKKVNQLLLAGPNAIASFKTYCNDMNSSNSAALIAQLRASEEGQEGLAAFLEKRKPNWSETIE
ncbi:MAG: enoyl-CoA hydratase/isomerase family protein [Candidatus Marinimicrobia bacterium]|nr:enoyl-CoA hydratase/isomerase family protein [Candidatus Neomarinimicrobiota bacterium]MBL7030031.1 enoyl-CoA hydratase/isomerase family protein [Candidatus Neomarinimicrobiota bacterium]